MSVQQVAFRGFANPVDPTPAELRAWAYHPDAVKLESVTYIDVLQRGLQVMDSTAITLCMDNSLPIIVFDVMQPGNITKALTGEPIGTLVHPKEAK